MSLILAASELDSHIFQVAVGQNLKGAVLGGEKATLL